MSETYYDKKNFRVVITAFIVAFIIFITIFTIREITKPLYIVVAINPNHGGRQAKASHLDGERYNELNRRFTVDYEEALYFQGLSEFELLSRLSKNIYNLLRLTQTSSGWEEFEKILKKYSQYPDMELKRVIFEPLLTKETNYKYYEKRGETDINKYFRIMDSPTKSLLKKYHRGILSFLYKYKPDIILSFDLNYKGSDTEKLFSINVPSYTFFNYIKSIIIQSNFQQLIDTKEREFKYIIKHWWGNDSQERTKNLLKDTWLYFTGYLPQNNFLKPDLNKFLGLGYNMFDWDFRDSARWYKEYDNKGDNPHYNTDLKLWQASGDFWEREQMEIEKKRREDGKLSYGGDNLYASEEIIKYIQAIFATEDFHIPVSEPVFVYDEISLYTTGISININLGSIYKKNTLELLAKYNEKLSRAICVGLYSIAQGYKIDQKLKEISLPVGAPIDFKLYHKEKYCGKKSRR